MSQRSVKLKVGMQPVNEKSDEWNLVTIGQEGFLGRGGFGFIFVNSKVMDVGVC